MTEDKSSNLMIVGIIAAFFAYLIYMKSKDTSSIIQPTQQSIDNIELYKIQLQTQQINDTLKLQMTQITLMQEQQLRQSESISNLETIKCSNVVSMNNRDDNIFNNINNTKSETTKSSNIISMNNNDYNNDNTNINNNINTNNSLRKLRLTSNVGRENEEFIANTIFGMK